MRYFKLQLADALTGEIIQSSGGMVEVCQRGSSRKQTIYNKDGTAKSNPFALTNGNIEFYTADASNVVDLYIMAPGGQFRRALNVGASGNNEIVIDTQNREQVAYLPFHIADMTANVEYDSGFDLPTNSAMYPKCLGALIATADAGITLDVGILSSESGGDADGLIAALSTATAIFTPAQDTVTVGGTETYLSATTVGALLEDFLAGANSGGDVGTSNKKHFVCNGTAKSVSMKLASGADTAAGFVVLPYVIAA